MKPAAEYVCTCGHVLDLHERPASSREPWGPCTELVSDPDTRRCPCHEAWPLEDD